MSKHNTLRPLGESITTTGATPTALSTFTPQTSKAYQVLARVVALDSALAQGAGYVRVATFRVNADGTVTQVGSTVDAGTNEDDAAWDCTIDTTAGTIRVLVTGEAATTINWRADVEVLPIGFEPDNS